MQAGRWLNYVTTFLRLNKLFDSFIMKLLHVSQLLRITCAAARRKNCGSCGFSKFWLAWRRANFFPAAARQGSGWRRNSAAEGSTAFVSMSALRENV